MLPFVCMAEVFVGASGESPTATQRAVVGVMAGRTRGPGRESGDIARTACSIWCVEKCWEKEKSIDDEC